MSTRQPLTPPSATLQDVADRAGVHRSTASRALNPETARLISPDVVARIEDAARALNYRRNLLAAGLITRRTGLVGVLVPDMANPVFAPILAGIEAGLAASGYSTLVANARGTDTEQLALVADIAARGVEGLVLATVRAGDPVLDWCLKRAIPTVLVNRADPAGRAPAATSDDRLGMRLAVDHLIALGHRRIAHLAGPRSVSTGINRRAGWEAAMRAAGLRPGPVASAAAYTREAGREAARALLRKEITAIVAANDLLALGAYQVIAEQGLRCPGDVSVTGHNDMPLVDMVHPPLTTVRIDHDKIGRLGASLLLERIAGPDGSAADRLLAPSLIVRGSTAPPPTD